MKKTPGIWTMRDLLDRCRLIEGGCAVWGLSGGARPRVWLPAAGKTVSAGAAIAHLQGRPLQAGETMLVSCDTPGCMVHRRRGTYAERGCAGQGCTAPLARARLAARKRASSSVSDAMISLILAAPTSVEAARRCGVSQQYASKVRRGVIRRPIAHIAAGL